MHTYTKRKNRKKIYLRREEEGRGKGDRSREKFWLKKP